MVKRVIVLVGPDLEAHTGIDWSAIGQVVTEISHLYQIAKESDIDLVLVDESHTDFKRPVATRLRRFNGLTEIWKLVSDDLTVEPEQDFLDGVIPVSLGHLGISKKVEHILHTKELLNQYGMVGRSARMKAIAETISRIAPTNIAVMIVGASGSGKELVALAIHRFSDRHEHPFVAVNCGAISEGILESELFGHEKGAFTGSVARRDGLFHKADGGTIFLDEIGETKPDMQVKLLRVLEDGTYYPVGSSEAKKTDVRVVSATNRDLGEAIAEREFREDLYFRIGVVKIVLPPLMDRKGDIQPLLRHFWAKQPKLDYSDSALNLLMKYDWPGNIRQLRNFADRMMVLKPQGLIEIEDVERFMEEQNATATHLPVATGRTVEEAGQELIYRAILSLGNEIRILRDLITAHLPGESTFEEYSDSSEVSVDGGSIEEMEKRLIERVLEQTEGNRKEAAKQLGIGERTLYRKLKKYNLR